VSDALNRARHHVHRYADRIVMGLAERLIFNSLYDRAWGYLHPQEVGRVAVSPGMAGDLTFLAALRPMPNSPVR